MTRLTFWVLTHATQVSWIASILMLIHPLIHGTVLDQGMLDPILLGCAYHGGHHDHVCDAEP